MASLAMLPTGPLVGNDFDPYVWDPDQWLATELGVGVCRQLLGEFGEAMDAYQGITAPTAEPFRTDTADSLILALLALVIEQRIQSPARRAHLMQCLGAQLYRLNEVHGRSDPLLYWTSLSGNAQELLDAATSETLGGRLRKSVAAWLSDCGVDVIGDADVVQVMYRLAVPHLKAAGEVLRHTTES